MLDFNWVAYDDMKGCQNSLERILPHELRASATMTKLLLVLALILPMVVSGVMIVTLPPMVSPLASPCPPAGACACAQEASPILHVRGTAAGALICSGG
jgi:hypothetical protein